jgi:hypothetical protein
METYGLSHTDRTAGSGVVGVERFFSTNLGRDRFNNCDHYRDGGFMFPVSGVMNYDRDLLNACELGHRKYYQYLGPAETVLKHPRLDTSEAQRVAWHTMQPEFAGNVAMLNFIFELKDFKSIAKYLARQPLKKMANAFRRWRRDPKFIRKFDPTRPIAEAHLVNAFAIKPLISDILAIQAQLQEMVREAQDTFQLEGLEGNTRHYTQVYPSVKDGGSYKLFRSGTLYQTTFTATLSYEYQYSMRADWDAFTRYWGFDLSPEVVWNGVPFSFLADYFINIGETLALLDHDPNVNLNVMKYCESLLTQSVKGLYRDGDYNAAPYLVNNAKKGGGEDVPVAGHMSQLYTRRVTSPNKGTVLPHVQMPTTGQWTNVAALVRCIL